MDIIADADEAPVLIVKDGEWLVHAGEPKTFKKKLLGEYAQDGYTINTITIKEYRNTTWKWIWDKPKP